MAKEVEVISIHVSLEKEARGGHQVAGDCSTRLRLPTVASLINPGLFSLEWRVEGAPYHPGSSRNRSGPNAAPVPTFADLLYAQARQHPGDPRDLTAVHKMPFK